MNLSLRGSSVVRHGDAALNLRERSHKPTGTPSVVAKPTERHSAAPAKLKGKKKVHAVMSEYKAGDLKSSSGQTVTKKSQAVAIALSEAGLSKKRKT